MTDIVVPPVIDLLPSPPLPQDSEEEFDTKSYTMVAAQVSMVPQINAAVASANQNATAAQERAAAAASSVNLAEDAAADAATQKTQALASAQDSAASAAASQVSAASAAASEAEIQKFYLGAKTAVPAVDNQGNPLQIGSWYTYTGSDPALKGWHWWDGTAWQLGVGDVGSAFISKVAGVYDSTSAMSGAPVQSMGLYAAAANAHHADWPVWTPGAAVTWVVQTYGDANSAVQKAQLSSDTGICFERSKAAGVWGAWVQNVTSRAFMERLAEQAVVGGSGASVTLDPAAASIHVLTLTAGALAVNLVAPRKLGDQVTVRIVSSGGAWPLTFGANIKLPTGAIPTYSAGQALTLVFVAMRAGFWDCYYSGVHA